MLIVDKAYTPEMVKEDYEKLKSGEKNLADLQDYFGIMTEIGLYLIKRSRDYG